jgi:hypothetical protein
MDSEELEEAILQLPATQRARLAQLLIASLDEAEAIAAAWGQEAERRHEEIVSGRLATRPAAEVFAEARTQLARRAAGGCNRAGRPRTGPRNPPTRVRFVINRGGFPQSE